MSPTVDHYRIVPALIVPDYASDTLKGIVKTTHTAIQANVDNLGAGTPSSLKLLRDNRIVDDKN